MEDKPFRYKHNKKDDDMNDPLVKSVAFVVLLLFLVGFVAIVFAIVGVAKWIWGL